MVSCLTEILDNDYTVIGNFAFHFTSRLNFVVENLLANQKTEID